MLRSLLPFDPAATRNRRKPRRRPFARVLVTSLLVLCGAGSAWAAPNPGPPPVRAFCAPNPCTAEAGYKHAFCDEVQRRCIECDGDLDTYCTQA